MSITATELKSNLGKYLLLAATEDIFITRNGKVVAKLSNPHQDRVDIAKSLFGILPADVYGFSMNPTFSNSAISFLIVALLQFNSFTKFPELTGSAVSMYSSMIA